MPEPHCPTCRCSTPTGGLARSLALVPARPTLVLVGRRTDRGSARIDWITAVGLSGLSGGLLAFIADDRVGFFAWFVFVLNAIGWGLFAARALTPPPPAVPESVAEVRKMEASARITVTVLRNQQFLAQRVIEQRFNGETLDYDIEVQPSGQLAKRETITLALTTHVINWERTRPAPSGSAQPPFIGGTREDS